MRVLGLIPARGGSQRLPNKNMQLVGGDPLVGHAIRHSFGCDQIALTAVTSDSFRIGQYSSEQGALVIHRPAELSRGDQPMQLTVVAHALAFLQRAGFQFDAVCLLQPTSPFRTSEDITRAITILRDSGGDCVVSVSDGDDNLAFQVRHANRLEKIPNVMVCNGAIYLATVEHLARGDHWFNGLCYGYTMPKDRSLDIDTAQDLSFAQLAAGEHAARL